MASQRNITRRRFKNDPAKARRANALVKKTKRELERLMRRRRAGTITGNQMDLGLKEIYHDMLLLQPFKRHYLK